ncbi:precorrin-8X methylmutase [Candidatus Nitrosotenuis cloacae]|jgi:precorrin-8X/cobalt-precorrin-8 methylmutase|uniref:Precorrin-8X methylmutase n=1 Tax=Candidatus Nitrosotenuis cloacae TaxID=1603555 RepID=A0A3G1B5K7_9ARCH|nr:precorrin-8X methylmutase [Candidatus Nitrosotenuis cloacae]AJZ76104.1 precorrin-8X methylmutase [Candidatus Nitrosotenuis cloacae]
MQTRKGQSIEDESMEIIEREIGPHPYKGHEWKIVRRIIHSTADFDFAGKNGLVFHKDAVNAGLDALKSGKNIIVDVNGIIGLLNKQNLQDFKNQVICDISNPDVVKEATKLNKTRAQTAMRIRASEMNGAVVVIGNAPTALLEVIQMVKENATRPSLIIGVPVGFVCASESKDELQALDIPFITNKGRKGGSPCASAIINALFKIVRGD